MTWTFYFLLMGCLLIPTIFCVIDDSVEKEERPAVARRSLKKEGKQLKTTFRGEYTTRGRKNANNFD